MDHFSQPVAQDNLDAQQDVLGSCPQSTGRPKFFLDVFAGARAPVFSALKDLGVDCIEPIDKINGDHHDVLSDDVFEALLRLAASSLIQVSLCAPYCSKHSRATLYPGGPRPVRTPSEPQGCSSNTIQQNVALQDSAAVHDRSRILSDMVMSQGGIATLENPLRSMTWLDDLMAAWVKTQTPFLAEVAACQYGEDWLKHWLFVSNHPCIHGVAAACPHDWNTHVSVGGRRLPDGSFFSRLTAEYPPQLAQALARCFRPHLSAQHLTIKLLDWIQQLPRSPTWFFASSLGRIEDGGSLASTARWLPSDHRDPLERLRKAWLTRLSDSKLYLKITRALCQPSKVPPVDEASLEPFLEDLRLFLECDMATWTTLLERVPGQPFRLNLWEQIMQLWHDPDTPFFDELRHGVRLGVDTPLDPSPLWPTHVPASPPAEPLSIHTGQWAGASEHPEIVQKLLDEEIHEGWIQEVPGGIEQLQREHPKVAVGKLNLVLAENRNPRLVVDSSVSGVTANTVLPNRITLPRITDVIAASQDHPSQLESTALALDIAKAHRRILIHPQDRGLLAFHFGSRLFKSNTLNFGARASGFYWGRTAAMLVRSLHRLLFVPHAIWIYVDDLLASLDRKSAPLYASVVILMCLVLGVPLSWAKAQLAQEVVWIGWQINLSTWTITIMADKRHKILDQLQTALSTRKVQTSLIESLIGRLLWITSAWHQLRPLLNPLYRWLIAATPTMMSVSAAEWYELLPHLDDTLTVMTAPQHPGIFPGMQVFRLGNHNVGSKEQAASMHFRSRRIWLGISDPACHWRKMSPDVNACLHSWYNILSSTTMVYSMIPRHQLQCIAAADAMADESSAGIGGYVQFPSGQTGWFQLRFSAEELRAIAPWISGSLQHHICTFELLGQCLLLQLTIHLLGGHRQHAWLTTACDNTASEIAATKGLSSSIGISKVLPPFFRLQRLSGLYHDVRHIPGHRNDLADALSRFKEHGLPLEARCEVDIKFFLKEQEFFVQPDSFDPIKSFAA